MHSSNWTPLTAAVTTILAIYEDGIALVWDMRDLWKHSMSASTELAHLEAAFKECHSIVDAALLAGKGRFGCEFEFADNTTILELRHVTSYLDSKLLGPISRGPVSQDSRKRASLKATSALLQVAEEGCQQAVKCLRDLYIRLEEISSVIGQQAPTLDRTTSARTADAVPRERHTHLRRPSSAEAMQTFLQGPDAKRWARSSSILNSYSQRGGMGAEEPAPLRTPSSIQGYSPPQRSHEQQESLAALVQKSLHITGADDSEKEVLGSPGPTVARFDSVSIHLEPPEFPQKSMQRPNVHEPATTREQSWFSASSLRSGSLSSTRQSSLIPSRQISRSSSNVEIPLSLQLRAPGFSRNATRSSRSSYDRPFSPFSGAPLRPQDSVRDVSPLSTMRYSSDVRRTYYDRRTFSFASEPLVEDETPQTVEIIATQTIHSPELVPNDENGEKTPLVRSTEVEMHATITSPTDCWTPTFYSAPTYAQSDSDVDSRAGDSDPAWYDETTSDASSALRPRTSISSITTAMSQDTSTVSQPRDPHSSLMPQDLYMPRTRDPHSSIMPQEFAVPQLRTTQPFIMPRGPQARVPDTECSLMVQELEQPTFLPTPSPWNNYLGFCIGAWRAQSGSAEAMVERQVMNVHHSKTTILKCSNAKCVFSGAGSDTKIWEAHNVRFRRPFLIKTHCAQKRVKKAMYTFQCPICVLLKMKSTIIIGTDAYLEHVSTHRGQRLPAGLLERLRCVNDRYAGEDEEFDINILPFDFKKPESTPSTPWVPGGLHVAKQPSGVSELGGVSVQRYPSPVSEMS